MHQAFSSLGYALRKTGDFEASLVAYDRALEINPSYFEAIEYRAEAYLGLDRVEEAKAAYLDLFGRDPERAEQLLTAMKGWLQDRREAPGSLNEGTLSGMEDWIREREELAQQAAKLSQNESGGSW